jgi:hypothetical protein
MPTLRFQALREASNKPVQFEETDRKSTILVRMCLTIRP